MERGEFKKTIETVAKQADIPHIGMSYQEICEARIPEMIVKLIRKITEQAEKGEKWATIMGHVNAGSVMKEKALWGTIVKISDFMQQEGFQTDEAQVELEGTSYRQLTVFWDDGKNIYEHELHRLGKIDLTLVEASLIM